MGSHPKEYCQTVRCLKLLHVLAVDRHGLTVTEMERIYKVCKRTIYRDMYALQLAGFPLVSDSPPEGRISGRWSNREKRWRLMRSGVIPVSSLHTRGGQRA